MRDPCLRLISLTKAQAKVKVKQGIFQYCYQHGERVPTYAGCYAGAESNTSLQRGCYAGRVDKIALQANSQSSFTV